MVVSFVSQSRFDAYASEAIKGGRGATPKGTFICILYMALFGGGVGELNNAKVVMWRDCSLVICKAYNLTSKILILNYK